MMALKMFRSAIVQRGCGSMLLSLLCGTVSSNSTASTTQASSVHSSFYQWADRIVPGALNAKGGKRDAKVAGVEVAPLTELGPSMAAANFSSHAFVHKLTITLLAWFVSIEGFFQMFFLALYSSSKSSHCGLLRFQ